jgi:hypothetical protein
LFFVCNSFFLKTSLIANQFYPTCFAIHFPPVRFCMVMAPNHRSIEMTFVFSVLCCSISSFKHRPWPALSLQGNFDVLPRKLRPRLKI